MYDTDLTSHLESLLYTCNISQVFYNRTGERHDRTENAQRRFEPAGIQDDQEYDPSE